MVFDPASATTFTYREMTWYSDRAQAVFRFELSGPDMATEVFQETIQFTPTQVPERMDEKRIGNLLTLLGLVLSTSYYKAAAPGTYVIDVPGMTEAAVDYLKLVLRHGMAEFAYRNGFDSPLEPTIVVTHEIESAWPEESWSEATGDPLVPIGGGKDSVVTVEILQRQRLHPIQFAVNANPIIHRVARVSGHPLITARRTIDERLLELNRQGALNGHVPVTAMNSLIALIQARIVGVGPVVMSNEASASEATLAWGDTTVNHQWSKSLDAELAMQTVIGHHAGLGPDHYFSLLRPFSELRIAGVFANLPRYHHVATSCNRAFRMEADDESWCGECDKCRFIYLVLSAYLSPGALRTIFGSDLLDDEAHIPGFEALLGLDHHKPFECVGSEAESTVALSFAARRPDWARHAVVKHFLDTIPHLATPHPDLERPVFDTHPSSNHLPEPYQQAQRALS
jgi:UDP-N-acetyl-alpha-D-muramoyl-L-alanyl-L-glutamate epimerase